MAQDNEQIRDEAISIIQLLIPGYPPLPTENYKEAHQLLQQTAISDDNMKRVHLIYKHLLSLLPVVGNHWRPNNDSGWY